jgi:hypothetical protein
MGNLQINVAEIRVNKKHFGFVCYVGEKLFEAGLADYNYHKLILCLNLRS